MVHISEMFWCMFRVFKLPQEVPGLSDLPNMDNPHSDIPTPTRRGSCRAQGRAQLSNRSPPDKLSV